MNQPVEIYQPMPDNLIRIHASDDGKKLEILADYKDEDHFSVYLTNSEASWLASELKSPHGINWKRLENEQVLRVVRSDEIRQLILSDMKNGQEISAVPIGIILDEVLNSVIEALN